MIRNKSELGDPIRIRMLLEVNGVPATGQDALTRVRVRRDSDGMMYDFDDDTWKVTPTTDYHVLAEDSELPGSYIYNLATTGLLVEDILTFHLTCSADPVHVEEVQFEVVQHEDYTADGILSHDYDSGLSTMSAVLLRKEGVVTTADRAFFSVYKAIDGSFLLEDYEVTSHTNGVFVYSVSTLGLEAHTSYFLLVSVEDGNQSYKAFTKFTTL